MAADDDRTGQVIGDKWRVERLLGKGSMATVYAVVHRNGAKAALKVLHRTLIDDEGAVERFLAEGSLANTVSHPGIVKVLDDGKTEDKCPYLVMELLDGMTLEQLRVARGGYVAPMEMLELAKRLMDALVSLHEGSVIHRDLKPTNVFLTNEGTVKLLDFGLARSLISGARAKSSVFGVVMGTPSFMSPEQALGKRDDVDAQSDVWSVGAILFTLLTGQVVHPAPTIEHRLIAAASKRARSLTSVIPTVDKTIAEVIDRALAFEKKDRWPDMRSMRDALLVKLPAQPPALAQPAAESKKASFTSEAKLPSVEGLGARGLPSVPGAQPAAVAIPRIPSTPDSAGDADEDAGFGAEFDAAPGDDDEWDNASADDDVGGATQLDMKPPKMSDRPHETPTGGGLKSAKSTLQGVAPPDLAGLPGMPGIPIVRGAGPAPAAQAAPAAPAGAVPPAPGSSPGTAGGPGGIAAAAGRSAPKIRLKAKGDEGSKDEAQRSGPASTRTPVKQMPVPGAQAKARAQVASSPGTSAAPSTSTGASSGGQIAAQTVPQIPQPVPQAAPPAAAPQIPTNARQPQMQTEPIVVPSSRPPPKLTSEPAPGEFFLPDMALPAIEKEPPISVRLAPVAPPQQAAAPAPAPVPAPVPAGIATPPPAPAVAPPMPPPAPRAPTPSRDSVPHQAPVSVSSSAQMRAQQPPPLQPAPVQQPVSAPGIPIAVGTPAMDYAPAPHIIPNADARPMAEPTMLVRQAPPPPPPAKSRVLAAVIGAILVLVVGAGVGFMLLRKR